MEAAETARVGMRLVARVDERAAVHRVDADQLGKEIGALRNLEAARAAVVLALPADLARARVELARDEERRHRLHEPIPRNHARDEVIVVAAVGMAAEIGIVLVELHRAAAAPGHHARALLKEPFARLVLRDEIDQRGAFGRRVFGVGVVVVKARAVAQDEIALDFLEGQFAARVLRIVIRFIGVLPQFGGAKPARVAVRIFRRVIPKIGHAVLRGRADQRDRFLDDIRLRVLHDRDAQFRFQTETDGPWGRVRLHGEAKKLELRTKK